MTGILQVLDRSVLPWAIQQACAAWAEQKYLSDENFDAVLAELTHFGWRPGQETRAGVMHDRFVLPNHSTLAYAAAVEKVIGEIPRDSLKVHGVSFNQACEIEMERQRIGPAGGLRFALERHLRGEDIIS